MTELNGSGEYSVFDKFAQKALTNPDTGDNIMKLSLNSGLKKE